MCNKKRDAALPSATAKKLKSEFGHATDSQTLGGSEVLNRLGDLADGCSVGSGAGNAVAFILSRVLYELAEHFAERPVSKTEIDSVFSQIHQPIQKAIEFVNSSEETLDVSVCTDLVSALKNVTRI